MARAPDSIRGRLALLIARENEDVPGLSRLVGRLSGRLGRYLRQGKPEVLPDHERETLADHFGMHRADLSSRDLKTWKGEQVTMRSLTG